MVDKLLVWCGNALLASVLVLLAVSNTVWAQDTVTDPAAEVVAPPDKISVPLSGTAAVKRVDSLAVTPNPLEFGLIEIGDINQQSITLTHTGDAAAAPVVIKDAVLFGKSAEDFATDFNGFVTLYGGDVVTINVVFTPLSPGGKSAGLRIEIDGATAPYVMLFNGESRYPLTSKLKSSDATLNFGQVIENLTIVKNFLLTNNGEPGAPAINVSGIQLGGDTPQEFNVEFTPTVLAAGETLDVKVSLSSPNQGFKSAEVEIFHDGINPTVEMNFEGNVVIPSNVPVNFSASTLNTTQLITRGTSLQFGPDGKLYVSEMDGPIHVFNVTRNGKNNYSANKEQTINLIKNVPNHNDDGTSDFSGKRLLTGIHVTGTAGAPIIYAASSDPRQAAGPSGNDSNLDTNSGILHKLTKAGGGWNKQDLVRGLPRSEENHVSNGLVLVGNKILLNVGGNTNQGVPSNNFAELPEYALSAATLEIDLGAIGNSTYDLPTLDDESRAGVNDANDPFGGNDGKNQAKLVAGGPVQIFASGLRNAYDIVYSQAGNVYVWDNGPNTGWGGTPNGNCANNVDNGGNAYQDGLHLITKGYYAGHPNPTRGNKGNTFNNSNPQSPVEINANPVECNYKQPGADGALTTIAASTNGLDEYTATNFAGSMYSNLLAASFDKSIYRIQLNGPGTAVTSKSKLAQNVGQVPLDVTSQGDGDVFPGTVWVVDNIDKTITVLEPSDY